MQRLLIVVCSAMVLCLLLAAHAWAHKVNIFAYVDGDTVVTESGYSRSQRVQHGTVTVSDEATGEVLLTGTTDEQGNFSFTIPKKAREAKMNLHLLLDAGVGHQGHWTVKYDEYAAGDVPTTPAAPAESATTASSVASAPAVAAAPAQAPVDTAAIEAVVRREVAPIKQMLLEMHQTGPGITEIVGGIGWIFGLFGVAAYMKSRRS
ncbi:hypothetical protein [Pseudodesulfovibrio sp.]|uniref:hypothetical protein n=1 Tax=unclassified Pseudodesulfovibrio TaxID=2661612 RepID=UPI003B00E400